MAAVPAKTLDNGTKHEYTIHGLWLRDFYIPKLYWIQILCWRALMGFELEAAIVQVRSVAHRPLRFVITLAVTALAVAGCAQVQQRQQLAEPVGAVMRTPVGGTIATIAKERDLPNAFGRADIYGRTVDAGFTRLIYRGRNADRSE